MGLTELLWIVKPTQITASFDELQVLFITPKTSDRIWMVSNANHQSWCDVLNLLISQLALMSLLCWKEKMLCYVQGIPRSTGIEKRQREVVKVVVIKRQMEVVKVVVMCCHVRITASFDELEFCRCQQGEGNKVW